MRCKATSNWQSATSQMMGAEPGAMPSEAELVESRRGHAVGQAFQPDAVGAMPSRSGITLLEVLISILVLTVGILGMVALVPIGAHETGEAAKLDHGSALGRAAFRDLEVRGYLDPKFWCNANGDTYIGSNNYATTFNQFNQTAGPTNGGPLQCFVLDPLMVAYNAPSTGVGLFPYNLVRVGSAPTIPRLSVLASINNGPGPALVSSNTSAMALADRIFRSSDDPAFAPPTFDRKRPAAMYQRDGSNNPIYAQSEGNYSWFVTVSPSLAEMTAAPPRFGGVANEESTRQYTVSVVVCHNRDLSIPMAIGDNSRPGEWMAQVQLLGGGEVRISGAMVDSWLNSLRPGKWIMLSGAINHPTLGNVPIAEWYRIVASDDGDGITNPPAPLPPHRNVTLHGPDWPATQLVVLEPPNITTYATIIGASPVGGPRVVAVYQKTITLGGTSPW